MADTKLEVAEGRLARWKQKAKETAGIVMATAEVAGAGFGAGYLRGRYGDENGDWKIAGVDGDLGLAFVLHGLAFANTLGQYDEHAHNLGNGFLASWTHAQGMRMGDESKTAALTGTQGARQMTGAGRMRPADALRAYAARAHAR